MRLLIRLTFSAALLAAAMVTAVAPTFAAHTTNTIAVSCSNGFSRNVSSNAARGVAKALTNFNAHNHKNVTCSAAQGAPRPAPAANFVTVTCSNGFERKVNAKAADAVVAVLNAYAQRKNLGVTCAAA